MTYIYVCMYVCVCVKNNVHTLEQTIYIYIYIISNIFTINPTSMQVADQLRLLERQYHRA